MSGFWTSRLARWVVTILTAGIGGALFTVLQLPIPWLLGPMIAALIGASIWRKGYDWPPQARDTGMIIVGYTIGLSLTASALRQMAGQLPSMLLMTLLLLTMCSGIAFVVSKLSGVDYMTVLMGSIPGGLTQMVALAEETKGINITVVTVTQVIRLMMIIVSVPLLVFSPLLGLTHTGGAAPSATAALHHGWGELFPAMLIFAPVCVLCAWGGNKIRFPTAFLLGPALATCTLQLLGLEGPQLPALLVGAAQLMIGTHVGLMLRPGQLANKARSISLALASAIVLIAGSVGLSLILSGLEHVSLATALLSLAPGGMDQMGIMAQEVGANLSMVAGYQLFRTFFIFLAVPPLLRLLIRGASRRKARMGGEELNENA
ncbi:AbrB family transcriptional regulator [Paenibacillus sp. CAA11]|nr:AbrB family transcriptional regulator [Paenibacillus sp. CAA11]